MTLKPQLEITQYQLYQNFLRLLAFFGLRFFSTYYGFIFLFFICDYANLCCGWNIALVDM